MIPFCVYTIILFPYSDIVDTYYAMHLNLQRCCSLVARKMYIAISLSFLSKILFHFDTHYLNINLGLCEFNVGFLLIKIRFNVSIHGEGVFISTRKELRKHCLKDGVALYYFLFWGIIIYWFRIKLSKAGIISRLKWYV